MFSQKKVPKGYLSLQDTRIMLCVDDSTLRRWRGSGKLNVLYVGGKVYYREKEVIEMRDRRRANVG